MYVPKVNIQGTGIMIKINNNIFELHTENTTYIFRIMETGHPEHIYYGGRLDTEYGTEPLMIREEYAPNNTVVYSEKHPFSIENRTLEVSGTGVSDMMEGMVRLRYADGSSRTDFIYESHELTGEKPQIQGLPSSYADEGYEGLVVTFKERWHNIRLKLTYGVFADKDIITRSADIENGEKESVFIERLYSNQLDFNEEDFTKPCFVSFHGSWANEMNLVRQDIRPGIVSGGIFCGESSSRINPFVMITDGNADEYSGKCMAFNLVYSGNHHESVNMNTFGKVRFLQGINPYGFSWKLDEGESFYAPEAVMTYSDEGISRLSRNMHDFVNNNIVRGPWKNKPRPVLINSWESYYMQFDEEKLLKLAKTAKEAGVELFVLDDGWFGKRNDDTTSLGDWFVNKDKLPEGLSGLSKGLKKLGMDFGIWVEPEMVNEKSELYAAHPDWVLKVPYGEQSLCRHQMVLDLGRRDVREYIIKSVSDIIEEGNISYIKWDMNRLMSDVYSSVLPAERQTECAHRYMLGLYEVLETLTSRYPMVLWESCASGGNRSDLGMLCYMQQMWASDNTDAACRSVIQQSYSYAYPLSVIGAHVSASPNHQTQRLSAPDTRFNIAVSGMLGYELNMCALSPGELDEIKAQIRLYKTVRDWLVTADFYRPENIKFSQLEENENILQWTIVSKDKKHALHIYFKNSIKLDVKTERLDIKGLDEDTVYELVLHGTYEDISGASSESTTVKAKGSIFNKAGIKRHHAHRGVMYKNEPRWMKDFEAYLYVINAADSGNNL